ncbi:MAG: HlyC/CorC family transporter [Deltaproteobacteria bacterium]|nr:HlyC/CorC family transporter [Deltaproteobacteria bacterium]
MEIPLYINLGIIFFLLIVSGFFSGSEAALFSLSILQRERIKKNNSKRALIIEKLLKHPGRLIVTILIGNDLINITASVVAAYLCVSIFGSHGKWIAMAAMTFLTLLFAEVIPKTVSINNNERFAPFVSGIIYSFAVVITPLRWIFDSIAKFLIRSIGMSGDNLNSTIMEDDFLDMVNLSYKGGELKGVERDLIHNVFEFSDAHVFEVMTPLDKMLSLSHDTNGEMIIKCVKNNPFSRIPVYEKSIENITGILYAKDLLKFDIKKIKGQSNILQKITRRPFFVQETKKVDELFYILKNRHMHMAICLNEHGRVSGVVTMEDLLEELFGEIYDEYDKANI